MSWGTENTPLNYFTVVGQSFFYSSSFFWTLSGLCLWFWERHKIFRLLWILWASGHADDVVFQTKTQDRITNSSQSAWRHTQLEVNIVRRVWHHGYSVKAKTFLRRNLPPPTAIKQRECRLLSSSGSTNTMSQFTSPMTGAGINAALLPLIPCAALDARRQ